MLDKTTPTGKGIRTAYQAALGVIIGLATVVWAVPGVPHAVHVYLVQNALPLILLFGVPSGAVAFIQNKLEKK